MDEAMLLGRCTAVLLRERLPMCRCTGIRRRRRHRDACPLRDALHALQQTPIDHATFLLPHTQTSDVRKPPADPP